MATAAGVKFANKAKKTRNPLFFDEKYTGTEPAWDTERALEFSDDVFDHHLRQSFYYYNYYYNQKDTKKYVSEWAKSTGKFTKEDIKAFDRASDKSMPMTACSLIMAHRVGMPLRSRHTEFLVECIQASIKLAEPEAVVVSAVTGARVEVYRPTIQDRLNEKTSELLGKLEGYYDDVINGRKPDVKFYDFLTANNVAQSQLGKYETLFQTRKAELEVAQSKKDDQITEGYKHLKTVDFKRFYAFITELQQAIDQYRGVKKATKRVKAKKEPSKDKLVSKLQYLKESKDLKIVSVPPSDVVGAQTLWCFDTKTRKLFVYVADNLTGPLSIKGTTITGFDTAKSVGKTLRKPADQLKELAKAGRVQLRTFLKDINAVEISATGRINKNQLLLKVQ